ncbi:MAG: 5-guanidino-2-oxopentanoate decarboxylase [Hyphomicrobiales bacterium]
MAERAELSTGEALVGLLEAYGVTNVFGIPGVHNVEMYRALPRSAITHVLPRHEQGAGFMADGYARATGRPGVCFTITGPGLTNILTPMGQAYSDSVPMLVLSSALDIVDAAQGRGRLHEMASQRGAAQSITSAAMTAMTPEDVRDGVAESFARLATQRPRPTYVELPLDLLKVPAGEGWRARTLPGRSAPSTQDIARAAKLLSAAKDPVVIAGGGAVDAAEAATRLVDQLGALALTTIAGKGVIPSSHPLCVGSRMPQDGVKEMLKAADVVLAVGSELSETDFWELKLSIPGKLIRVDIDPASIARPHAAEIAILADARATLEALSAALPKADVAARRARNVERVRAYLAAEPGTEEALRSDLRQVLGVIRKALPEDTILATDMTQIAYAANEIFPVEHPRQWLHPAGFGTLGYALPAGIGAKVAHPERPVAVLAGDYGFQYTINELGTAAELGQNLVILLWNNDALGQIRDDMVMKGIQPNAVTLRNPDFEGIARAYGCTYWRPESLESLAKIIADALATEGRPTVIEMTPRMLRP